MNTAHFTNMATSNNSCPMVSELSSSVIYKTAPPVLPIVNLWRRNFTFKF